MNGYDLLTPFVTVLPKHIGLGYRSLKVMKGKATLIFYLYLFPILKKLITTTRILISLQIDNYFKKYV